jgi:HPt (histidine-containing phosphotransfer) domain-containing protein
LVDTAKKGLEAGGVDEVRRAAHTLKSNAATFGARALADRSRELEDATKQGTLDEAEKRIDRITDELADVRSALPATWCTVATPSAD